MARYCDRLWRCHLVLSCDGHNRLRIYEDFACLERSRGPGSEWVHAKHAHIWHAPHAYFVDITLELLSQTQPGQDQQEANAEHALRLGDEKPMGLVVNGMSSCSAQ